MGYKVSSRSEDVNNVRTKFPGVVTFPRRAMHKVTFTEEILNGKLHFLSSAHEVECTGVEKIIMT